MENKNMEMYNELKSVPKEMLKKIEGGRLKGMSDIKPQWRIQKLTEKFGSCGFGWYFEVLYNWVEDGANGEKIACVSIHLFVRKPKSGKEFPHNEMWSKGIYGTGGAMLVAKEKNGMHTNDEAFKMATTDAIGTASKCIGLAADVYMGKANESKYTAPAQVKIQKPVMKVDSIEFKKAVNYLLTTPDASIEAIKTKYEVPQKVDDALKEEVLNGQA